MIPFPLQNEKRRHRKVKPPAELVLEHSVGCAQLFWDTELWGFW